MADLKQFLDFAGLAEYDALLKEYIKTNSTDEVDKLIAELAEVAEKDAAQDEQLESLSDALEILNGDSSVEGSVDSKVESAITKLVDNAPETLDTLKEIADWISGDESGTAALIERVKDNEEKIEELQNSENELKDYVDAQDKAYFDSIVPIEDLKIASLFSAKQAADQSAAEAIAAVEEGKAIKLTAEQEISEDLTIDKSCFIDANGSVFTGTVTIPADVDVIIENATFSNPVVIA